MFKSLFSSIADYPDSLLKLFIRYGRRLFQNDISPGEKRQMENRRRSFVESLEERQLLSVTPRLLSEMNNATELVNTVLCNDSYSDITARSLINRLRGTNGDISGGISTTVSRPYGPMTYAEYLLSLQDVADQLEFDDSPDGMMTVSCGGCGSTGGGTSNYSFVENSVNNSFEFSNSYASPSCGFVTALRLKLSGTATYGVDYTIQGAPLFQVSNDPFATPGTQVYYFDDYWYTQRDVMLKVKILNDAIPEGNETFKIEAERIT